MYTTDLPDLLARTRDLRQKRDYREALTLFDKYIDVYANEGRFLASYALTYAEAGLLRSAIRFIDRALTAAPKDLAIHLDAARLYLLAGQPQLTLELCRRARALAEPTALLLGIEGDAHYQSGLMQKAVESYRAALDLDPNAEQPRARMGAADRKLAWMAAARDQVASFGSADAVPARPARGDQQEISVVIPANRGDRNIGAVLKALSLQTFPHFDVHVVHNASDDATLEAVAAYSGTLDIKLHVNAAEIGQNANLNRALVVSDRPLILLASPNDLFSSRYVEALHEKMQANEKLAFCHGGVVYLSAEGTVMDNQVPVQPFETDIAKPYESAMLVMRFYSEANQFFGLYRKAVLDTVGEVPFVYGGDHVHLLNVALAGSIGFVNEPLYFRQLQEDVRDHNTGVSRLIKVFSLDHARNIKQDSIYSSLDYLTPFMDMAWAQIEAAAHASVDAQDKGRIIEAIPGIARQRFGMGLEDDASRLGKFLDENEERLGNFEFITIRSRLLEHLIVRLMHARALLPVNPHLPKLMDRALALQVKLHGNG